MADHDSNETCLMHPTAGVYHAAPLVIRSAQSLYPTRIVERWRCEECERVVEQR